jgi:WD40 repeat protein
MASTSMQSSTTNTTMVLALAKTLRGHEDEIRSISYFPSGERMISGSDDLTTRQWDMQTGKEISKLRDACQRQVRAVAVSRDGRWVVTGGSHSGRGELKACDVQTGIVKTFEDSKETYCIDISADSTLLVSGAMDRSARIWSLETGKLVAGPFASVQSLGAVRFSQDSKKLAIMSDAGKCLDVWDVHKQKMDVRAGKFGYDPLTYASVFWTKENSSIIAAFSFTDDPARTVYEFDAATLKTVGSPFEGHAMVLADLALSSDNTLLITACYETIKLWAFESRHLLASFDVLPPQSLTLSPDSRQLAYSSGSNIYIYNTPAEILASMGPALDAQASVWILIPIVRALIRLYRPVHTKNQASLIY